MEPGVSVPRLSGIKYVGRVAVTVTGLVVAGCGTDKPDSTESAALAEHVGTYQAFGEGGNGALLEGTVRVVDGCLTVVRGDGEAYLPFFPDDEVRWNGGRLDYLGETFGDGDAIALGGGVSGIVEGATVPENCDVKPRLTPWTVAQED
ncbi:hypothetical protein [Nocardioides sp. 1609]|uniref:hypothetical protein n=1 Tax=Nocardioides sp. 1609 TaxID=2508327 RepID=UPI00106F77F3|nr:hypothetical protein [Nocardioides sp. 1609]